MNTWTFFVSCGLRNLAVVLLLFLAQLHAISVLGQEAEGDNTHQHRERSGHQMTLKKLNCILSRCSDQSGNALEVCSRLCEDAGVTTRSAPCVAPQCQQYSGVYRDLCEFTKCTLSKANVNTHSLSPMAAKRYNFDEIMWPDEFETRSSEEHEARANRVRSRRMSREETELGRQRKDLEEGRPVHSQGCSSICHGFTGKQYEHCVSSQCKEGNAPITLRKRWNDRHLCPLCNHLMHDDKAYFMCGQQHCG